MTEPAPRKFSLFDLMVTATDEAEAIKGQQERMVAAGIRTAPDEGAMLRAAKFEKIAATLEWLMINERAIRDAVRDRLEARGTQW